MDVFGLHLRESDASGSLFLMSISMLRQQKRGLIYSFTSKEIRAERRPRYVSFFIMKFSYAHNISIHFP